MNYYSYNRELSRLSNKKDKEWKELSEKIDKARKEEGQAKAHEVSQTERVDLDFILEDIAILKTNYLQQKLSKTIYPMPAKPYSTGQNDFWQQSHMSGEWYLTDQGYIEVYNLLEKVKKEKREKWTFWAHNIGVLTALIMALVAISQLILARSERLDAADALKKAQEALKLSQDANKTGEDLKVTLRDASKALSQLQLLTEFSDMVLRAHNDDAVAFDKVSEWADDKSYNYSSRAKEAKWAIFDKHGSGFWAVVPLEQYEDYHPSTIHNIKDIRQLYKKAESSIETFVKPSILHHMWDRKDIAEKDKIDFLIEVITSDKSLVAREAGGRLITKKLTKEGQPETHPLNKETLLKMAKKYRATL